MSRPALLSILVGFRTLRVNPLRTVLSTLGVIIGVAALVAVLALGDGMERFARDEIRRNGSMLAIEVRSMSEREIDGIRIPDTAAPVLTPRHARELARLQGVARVSMHFFAPTMVQRGSTSKAAMARGGLASAAANDSLVVAHGRFYSEAEVLAGAGVVVLADGLARALAAPAPPATLVGQRVVMGGQEATVVGVLAASRTRTGPRPARPEPLVAYLPVSAVERYQMDGGALRRANVLLMADHIENVRPIRDRVRGWVAARHPEWGERVQVRIDEARGDKARQGILLFKILMGAMTGISLLVGGIGIMNVLLASVAERTREIGIRKATGARHRDILVQFLSESVAISGLGSAIGLMLGFAGAVLVTAIMRRMTEAPVQAGFSLSTFVVTAAAAVFVGLVFGTYPALRAARLSPIEAMHHE